MAENRELRKRPIDISRDEEITSKNLAKIHRHYDDRLQELDQRRIAQQTEVEEGADTAATVANLVTAVNALLTALNASSMTED